MISWWIMSVKKLNLLHFSGHTTCEHLAKFTSLNLPIGWIFCLYSCDFTMTATLTVQLLLKVYQSSYFFFFFSPLRSGNLVRCWIGRQGCCQHHLCHLSCSAASCSSCDKARVYSGAENTGLNLAVAQLSLSVSSQTAAHIPPCQSGRVEAEQAGFYIFFFLFWLIHFLPSSCEIA